MKLTDELKDYQKKTEVALEIYINGINKKISALEEIYSTTKLFLDHRSTADIACHSHEKLKLVTDLLLAKAAELLVTHLAILACYLKASLP